MTLFLDTSALLALHVDGPYHIVARSALGSDSQWCASALALTETIAAIGRVTEEAILQRDIEDDVRNTWDFIHIVPVDQRCLEDAAVIAHDQPIGVSTAIHLAAASRLPQPVTFLTFDSRQIPVALSLGFDVVSG
ncbi:MAG: type II toxin-antitoxin system VapC family toxin [Ilumatobacteraceae bacterium]|nr:type II toxin-antitoxin system VapC family toxin [Ilumatobacteraceae bacterium]